MRVRQVVGVLWQANSRLLRARATQGAPMVPTATAVGTADRNVRRDSVMMASQRFDVAFPDDRSI